MLFNTAYLQTLELISPVVETNTWKRLQNGLGYSPECFTSG